MASVAQLDAHPTGDQELRSATYFSVDMIMKYFLRPFSPLIQEGHLSVSGEKNVHNTGLPLRGVSRPIKVWLGELTALDMTP